MRTFTITLSILSLYALMSPAIAQDKPAEPPIKLSVEAENKILKAEHSLDLVKQQEAALQASAQSLQLKWDDLQKQDRAATDEVNKAMDEAYAAMKLDKSKYDFNPASFTFTPKPPPPGPKVEEKK